jgi:hypothetical protein
VTQTDQVAPGYPQVEAGGDARALIAAAKTLSAALSGAAAAPGELREEARGAYEVVRAEVTRARLEELPLERIKEVTQGRLRLTAIEQAGYRTVGSVLRLGESGLDSLHGVGPQTALAVIAAARTLYASLEQQTRVRIDPDARTAAQTTLLAALYDFERAKANVPPQAPDYAQLQADLDALADTARPAGNRMRMLFTGSARKRDARDAIGRLAALLQTEAARDARRRLQNSARLPSAQSREVAAWLWNDYLQRPVTYNGLLIEVAGLAPDEESVQGCAPRQFAHGPRTRDASSSSPARPWKTGCRSSAPWSTTCARRSR